MDSSTPFHQQIKGRIISIAFLFCCFFIGILTIFYSRESDLFVLKREILPSIEKQLSNHKLIIDSEQLLTNILTANNPKVFEPLLSKYQQNLKDLLKNNVLEQKLTRQLLAELEPFILSVTRLSANHEKNEQLKQNTIVQLQLVNTALNDELENGVLTHQELYQQSIILFSQAVVMIEDLSVTTNIERFTQFTEGLNELSQQWFAITSDGAQTLSPSVAASLVELNNLLWVDQRSIAKWRSHIRISQEFLALMSNQYQSLIEVSAQFKLAQLPSNNMWPKEILPWLPAQLKSSNDAYYAALAIILSLFLLSLMLLLYFCYARIKRYQRDSIALIEQHVQGKVTLPITSIEQQQTFELLNQLLQPLHSEEDYQQLKASVAQQETLLSQHTHALIWHSNESTSQVLASEMLSLKSVQRWYHAFSRDVVKQILSDARQAKLDGGIIDTQIKDKQGRLFYLTIEYVDPYWQGTLSAKAHQAKLEQELEALNLTLNQSEQSDRHQRIENSQKLSKMLIRTMLQSQSASLGFGVAPLKVYRHLIRMLEWSKQLQLNTVLGTKDRQVQLTDVNFTNELYALMTNVLVDANLQRNSISYTVDGNIIAPCKLNIRLFHQTLSHFCQTLLAEQFKGHLHLAVTMADKNSGQQILNFSFTVTHLENGAALPETLASLTQIDEQQLEKEAAITQYFYRLFKASYCEQLQTKVIDNGYLISFKMPITTAVSATRALDVIDLNQRKILLLSKNSETIDLVEQLAKKHQATLSTISDAKHLVKQVNVKQLAKQAIAVVIVADDVFSNDFDLVKQHLDSLTKALKPKVFVLQPLCNQAFHRVGMYQHTQGLLNEFTFAKQFKQFIKSDHSTNLLLCADIFQPYRFSSTQVEVLLAVNEPKNHEVLQRLLHWMGLQVHLVCNQQQMLKQWKSGRYLLLINEFDELPLIPLDVGKKVKRSLYTFTDSQLTQYQQYMTDDYNHWDVQLLPKILDIAALVKVFSPWLKEHQLTSQPTAEIRSLKPAKLKKLDHFDTEVTALSAENAAFDLEKYAQNQGSSELAGFMIFDYINEIEGAITELITSLNSKDVTNVERCLQTITKVAKIMAANDLIDSCKLLGESLTKIDFKGCHVAMHDIQIKYQLLATYAEAI